MVGADGRQSSMRARAGLSVQEFGVPIDMLWFRLSRGHADPAGTMGRFEAGRIFVPLHRGEHWQRGYGIPKGTPEELRRSLPPQDAVAPCWRSGYNLARMPREVVLAPEAVEDLNALRAYERAALEDAMKRHLQHEPAKTSKTRIKRLAAWLERYAKREAGQPQRENGEKQ